MLEITSSNALIWSRMNARKTFGAVLTELAAEYPDVVVLAADVASSAGLSEFARKYPDRFCNVGIAEQTMLGMAAGLAMEGQKVFAVSFAPFASMRCFEMIRSYVGYMNLDVKVVGIASGLSLGTAGNTHYGLEDLALMRTVPNMTVLSPADCTETAKSVEALIYQKGPAYLRLTGVEGNPVVYKDNYAFKIGKGGVLREGTDVAIIATGTMVYESLRAAKLLSKENIFCTVVDMHTVKPLDTALLDTLFSTHKVIVTVEEHSVVGGLGSAVAEYRTMAKSAPRQLLLGLPDVFGKAGEYRFLLDKYGLTAKSIAARTLEELNR